MYAIIFCFFFFSNLVFSWVLLLANPGVYSFGGVLCVLILFFRLFIHFVMFFFSSYFTPKLFCFFYLRLLYCLCAHFTKFWLNFLSLSWNVQFYMNCFTSFHFLLNLFSFNNIFYFISSSCFVRLVCSCLLGGYFYSAGFLYISPFLEVSLVAVSLFFLLAAFFIQILYICSDTLRGYLFYLWLVLLLHGWTSSVQWCCQLG